MKAQRQFLIIDLLQALDNKVQEWGATHTGQMQLVLCNDGTTYLTVPVFREHDSSADVVDLFL